MLFVFWREELRSPGHKAHTLIGAKPCDIAALNDLDGIFTSDKGKFKDSFYINRRNCLTVVGAGCTSKNCLLLRRKRHRYDLFSRM